MESVRPWELTLSLGKGPEVPAGRSASCGCLDEWSWAVSGLPWARPLALKMVFGWPQWRVPAFPVSETPRWAQAGACPPSPTPPWPFLPGCPRASTLRVRTLASLPWARPSFHVDGGIWVRAVLAWC